MSDATVPPVEHIDVGALCDILIAAGVRRGEHVGLAASGAEHLQVGLAVGDRRFALAGAGVAAALSAANSTVAPRWVMWSHETATTLITAGVRLSISWDIAAVHRLLHGGWNAEPARVWALLHDLDHHDLPRMGQLDLLSGDADGAGGDPEEPIRPDGYLRPEWHSGGWSSTPARHATWAGVALHVARCQHDGLNSITAPRGDPIFTARSESTAELLCAELAADGLPIDVAGAHALIAELIGPRPTTEAESARERERRDEQVLRHLPPGHGIDLRSPADVKSMLRRLGIDVPDTRAWRLEQLRTVHPAVEALLRWRKAERVATTFGYGWLDAHVGAEGRLRGEWSASDGAAGRMTAGAGLHNLPAELRSMVVAEPGHVFVRADLGQIEPRVLAAVSGDDALIAATQDDDLYAPVASRLGVERAVAKIAVLAAMYGQTSGTAGQALRGMAAAYPVAMRYLSDAAEAGVEGRELRTFGGRLLRMWAIGDDADFRTATAARGRYARNAMVQGAAAELFKVWAVIVRARSAPIGARIVLCLHDELLLHVPDDHAAEAVELVHDCLAEAAHRWQPAGSGSRVRFVADVSVVRSWADAKQ